MNVVLYINSGCVYCTKSVRFYRSLSKLQKEKGEAYNVTVATRDKLETMRSYLQEHDIEVADVVHMDKTEMTQMRTTPTIFVS